MSSLIRGESTQDLKIKTKATHPQKQPRQGMQTAIRGNQGYSALSVSDYDSDSIDPNLQPEQTNTSKSRDHGSNRFLEEATAQWEMAKDLGMTWGSEQPKLTKRIKNKKNKIKQKNIHRHISG